MIRRLIILLLIVGCEEPAQHGCLDSQACNYDSSATIDNNSCAYDYDCADVCGGDRTLDNCDVCDNDDSNDCVQDCLDVWGGLDLCGCTDLTACNYNEYATIENDTCSYAFTTYHNCEENDCNNDVDENNICDELQGSVTDIDGNTYLTAKIGTQEWMAENLRVTKYRNGDEIPTNLNANTWVTTTEGAYTTYNHDPSNTDIYGNLYNWYTGVDERGVCPTGWNVSTEQEWYDLFSYLEIETYANKLQTSESGFNLVFGGYSQVEADGSFEFWGVNDGVYNDYAVYWYSDGIYPFNDVSAKKASMENRSDGIIKSLHGGATKYNTLSIRCLKD